MKKITVLFLLVSILITACNLSNDSGNDEQIVSMQQTIDAMQQSQSQNNEPASESQADPPTQAPPNQQPPTDVPTKAPQPTQPPALSPSLWTTDTTGVCRDDAGGYPRWSSYDWTISQCEKACLDNPNCQGFAMSKEKEYCQLFGSDGTNDASSPGTQITRGDNSYPEYTCYIKRSKPSLKAPPTNTPLVPSVLFNPKILLLEFDNQAPMVDTCNSVRQDMSPFGADQWREGDQLFGGSSNCSIRFELFVPQTGKYKMTLYATYAPDFANLKVYIGSNNNNTGSVTDISLYDASVRPAGPIDLGEKELSTNGTYFINFLVSGKTASSSDYKFGIDYLTWEPVK